MHDWKHIRTNPTEPKNEDEEERSLTSGSNDRLRSTLDQFSFVHVYLRTGLNMILGGLSKSLRNARIRTEYGRQYIVRFAITKNLIETTRNAKITKRISQKKTKKNNKKRKKRKGKGRQRTCRKLSRKQIGLK